MSEAAGMGIPTASSDFKFHIQKKGLARMNRTKEMSEKTHLNGEDKGEAAATGRSSAAPTDPTDPYNLESLRLTQDFASAAGVKPLTKTIPVKKPSKEWFIRTHPDPTYRLQTQVLELKDSTDRDSYLVAPSLWGELSPETTVSPRLLIPSISRQGVMFIWPIRLPGSDGKIDDWSRSLTDAADRSQDAMGPGCG